MSYMKLPVPDYVWAKIKEKFSMPLRYVVPGTGGTIDSYRSPRTGQPGFTKWNISTNVNFSPTFLTYDSADDSYRFKGETYTEAQFLEELNKMSDSDIKMYLEELQKESEKELSELLKKMK